MKLRTALFLLPFIALVSLQPSTARAVTPYEETLVNPQGLDMVLLHYRLRGIEPPFAQWAEGADTVRYADEFHKKEEVEKITSNMRKHYGEMSKTKFISLRMQSNFSEYDNDYNEYDLDLSNGSSLQFDAGGNAVTLKLINGSKAHVWKMGRDEAEKIYEKNHKWRYVSLDMNLEIVGSDSSAISAKILDFDILSHSDGLRLGHIVVPQ